MLHILIKQSSASYVIEFAFTFLSINLNHKSSDIVTMGLDIRLVSLRILLEKKELVSFFRPPLHCM